MIYAKIEINLVNQDGINEDEIKQCVDGFFLDSEMLVIARSIEEVEKEEKSLFEFSLEKASRDIKSKITYLTEDEYYKLRMEEFFSSIMSRYKRYIRYDSALLKEYEDLSITGKKCISFDWYTRKNSHIESMMKRYENMTNKEMNYYLDKLLNAKTEEECRDYCYELDSLYKKEA